MRIKYANPYFKHEKINKKLIEYIEKRKPKLIANPNINGSEEDQLSVPERSQGSWMANTRNRGCSSSL